MVSALEWWVENNHAPALIVAWMLLALDGSYFSLLGVSILCVIRRPNTARCRGGWRRARRVCGSSPAPRRPRSRRVYRCDDESRVHQTRQVSDVPLNLNIRAVGARGTIR